MKLTSLVKTTLLALGITLGALTSSALADDKKETAKPYPLDKCVVSDEKLGEMGDPYVFTHEGREVKLCCKSCLKKFNADSAKYIKKIEEAEKKAAKK